MQKYERACAVTINEVLNLILQGSKPKKDIIRGHYVKVSGVRLNTFAQYGTTCSACGLEATHFAIERNLGQPSYHLNLYGMKDNEEVLFTHDHTLARSLGGKDHISNTTTMCITCNQEKSVIERQIKERMMKDG